MELKFIAELSLTYLLQAYLLGRFLTLHGPDEAAQRASFWEVVVSSLLTSSPSPGIRPEAPKVL